jgi:hypothetical protein
VVVTDSGGVAVVVIAVVSVGLCEEHERQQHNQCELQWRKACRGDNARAAGHGDTTTTHSHTQVNRAQNSRNVENRATSPSKTQ